MAFGPIIRFRVGEYDIELAPIPRTAVTAFIADGGMQSHTVTQYLGRRSGPVEEDEYEWFDKVRTQTDSFVWGIWDITSSRTLIGSSSLHGIEGDHFRQAVSGSMIVRTEYWNKGIARACHKARTWFGFTQLGLTRIKSAVIVGNTASQRALERSGYTRVYVERNDVFVNGQFRDRLCLECLNPDPQFWDRWWASARPPKSALAARAYTLDALDWAVANVTLV